MESRLCRCAELCGDAMSSTEIQFFSNKINFVLAAWLSGIASTSVTGDHRFVSRLGF
jgi:hypothetical protein